MVSYILFE